MDEPRVTIREFEACYPSRTKATEALGCSRQTFYDWEKNNRGLIPDVWSYKAKALIDEIDSRPD